MTQEFEVSACRTNHAGKAHVHVTHKESGAEFALVNIPFDDCRGEAQEQMQQRIIMEAARFAQRAVEFLNAQGVEAHSWPTRPSRPGPPLQRLGEPPA